MDNRKILIIDPFGFYKKRITGIYSAIKSYLYCLEMIGYEGHVIDERVHTDEGRKWHEKIVHRIRNETKIDINFLKKFDAIHVHGPIGIRNTLKLYRCGKPAVLTLHGWVVDESLTEIRTNPSIIKFLHVLYSLFRWALLRLFLPFIYEGRVTAVSKITMEKNGVKGVVIPNAFIPKDVDKKVANCKDLSFENFTLVTYVSIGGSKVSSIPKLSRIIREVNKRTGKNVQLLVFGDPVKIDNPHIKMMGYRDDFLCYLKSANMMILGYDMSELGYAVMEAGYLSVPIAKFKGKFEELKGGFHGIIAETEEEMIQKLVEAVEDPSLTLKWGENIKNYILETRSPGVIAKKWQKFLESTVEK